MGQGIPIRRALSRLDQLVQKPPLEPPPPAVGAGRLSPYLKDLVRDRPHEFPPIRAIGYPRLNTRGAELPSIPKRPSPRIVSALSTPTWSVRSLLPADISSPPRITASQPPTASATTTPSTTSHLQSGSNTTDEITPTTLRHLCNLSALPPPEPNSAEEAALLHSLRTHLHFVRHIQSIPTSHVSPLVALRDETPEAIAATTIKLSHPDIQYVLSREKQVGKYGRIIPTSPPRPTRPAAWPRRWTMKARRFERKLPRGRLSFRLLEMWAKKGQLWAYMGGRQKQVVRTKLAYYYRHRELSRLRWKSVRKMKGKQSYQVRHEEDREMLHPEMRWGFVRTPTAGGG